MALTKVSGHILDANLDLGTIEVSTIQVGSGTTIHTTGIDLGSGNLTSHNINSTGIITATSVAIGTDNPGAKLHVQGTVAEIWLRDSNSKTLALQTTSTTQYIKAIDIGTGGLPLEFYASQYYFGTGNVGIGTDNANVDLHLHDSSLTRIQFTDDSTGAAAGDGVIMGLNGDDNFFINNRETSKDILLFTEDTERLRITGIGSVGIGSTQPSTALDIGGTGSIKIPFGNNAQRPTGSAGEIRINTEARAIEFHTGVGWALAGQVPEISSVTGDFFVGMPGPALTITGTAFDDTGTDLLVYDGSTLLDTLTGSNLTSTTFQVTVSSAVYNNISNGDTLTLIARTSGNIDSDAFSQAVQNTPTGGTVTSTGNYRVHTFTSASTNFVVPSGFSATAEYVIVAGGGSGGNNKQGSYENGGGGGAGGMISGNASISAQTYTIQVGAGGAIPSGNGQTIGGNSSALGVTANGGGGGSTRDDQSNINGGSGGGAVNWSPNTTRGTGVSGQGNNGGTAGTNGNTNGGSAGGGGKGAVGGSTSGSSSTTGANGGAGGSTSIRGGSAETFAGGGGGAGASSGSGGSGGGGNGGNSTSNNGSNGGTNTGGGGGGNYASAGNAGNGGSGIVIIRYKKVP